MLFFGGGIFNKLARKNIRTAKGKSQMNKYNSLFKNIDTFQIIGFLISAFVSASLLIAKQDTLTSITLGFVLAAFTQLFDLQKRIADSEEHLTRMNTLNPILYQDDWFSSEVMQIAEDYHVVKKGWFDLFVRRGDDAIVECKNILHAMAEGNLDTSPRGAYSFGNEVINKIKSSYKHVSSLEDLAYWNSTYAETALETNIAAVRRGVKIKRIFVQRPETLEKMSGILQKQKDAGIEIYLANSAEVPKDLIDDYVIADDQACAVMEISPDGHIKQQRITISPPQVEQYVKRFDILLHHARKI